MEYDYKIDLEGELAPIFFGVRDGTFDIKRSSELTNIAGKILKDRAIKLATKIYAERGLPGVVGAAAQAQIPAAN